MQKNCYWLHFCMRRSGGLAQLLLVMRMTVFLLLAFLFQVHASGKAQTVTISGKNLTLKQVFKTIEKQTGYVLFSNKEMLAAATPVSLSVTDMPLESFLRQVFRDQPIGYFIKDKTIVLSQRTTSVPNAAPGITIPPQAPEAIENLFVMVRGLVADGKTREPIAGASVMVKGSKKGTTTDKAGRYAIETEKGQVLVFSSVGYMPKEALVTESTTINVHLDVSDSSMKDVVVTGMFNRKSTSFTGSTATYSQKELLNVGNVNLVKSLANLDPSFRVMENLQFGSDPNRLADIQLRGQTGLPDLNNEYGTNPNLPLFILDGFETNLQRITDLDIYLVKSITILKDASSKAVYGSRAANGVVVIETLRPSAGKLQVTYNYNLNAELPDLSSYNLADAAQKLEIEMLTDPELISNQFPYSGDSWFQTAPTRFLYDLKKEELLRGVNTDWLAQPLRNGFGQRHSLTLGGGRDELQYYVELGYNDIKGVMKGSGRKVYSGGVQLAYRKNAVSVSNILRLTSSKGENSPYGSFQNFADANPYVRLNNDSILFQMPGYQIYPTIYRYVSFDFSPYLSPLYNGTIGVKDFNTEGNIINNTDLVWKIRPFLRLNGRLGLSKTTYESDLFLPAAHTSFPPVNPTSGETTPRGSYEKKVSTQGRMNANLILSYNQAFGEHVIFANAGLDANAVTTDGYGFKVVGFPNANLNYPAAAAQYAPDSRLSGTENKTRDIGAFAAANYSYDDRFLADLSWRVTRSSQFGPENPSAQFWSAGIGWNLHNERFMEDNRIFSMLRVLLNTGYTGTQPVNAYIGIPLYRYDLEKLYYGQYGLSLINMANPFLGAQRKFDRNISVSMGLLKNRLNITADYYVSSTDGLLIDINLPNSTGFSSFKANQGLVENTGIDLRVNYQVYQNTQKGDFISVYGTMGHNKNTLKELSNTLIALTSSQDKLLSNSLKQRFEVGSSINTIWAVPSLGIDPATGKEVFLKKDGSTTYDWDAADQIAAGDAAAKFYGNFGIGIRFSGWQLNASFAYNLGGKKYNTTLVNKVENIDRTKNVDERVFTSRWRKPGDISQFKSITDFSPTYPTTRFVEDWNDLTLANINLTYDLDRLPAIKRTGIRRLRAGLAMSNAFVLSSMQIERGTDYPFARTLSFTLQTNF